MKKSLIAILAISTLCSLHAAPQQADKKAVKSQTKIKSPEAKIKVSAAMQAIINAVLADDQDKIAESLKQGIEAGDVQVKAICGAIIMDINRIDVELSTAVLAQLGLTVDQLRIILPEPTGSKVVMAIAQILIHDESMQELLADVVVAINEVINTSVKKVKKSTSKNATKTAQKTATKRIAEPIKTVNSPETHALIDAVAAQDEQKVNEIVLEGIRADSKQITMLVVLALFMAAGKTAEQAQDVLIAMGVTPQDVPQSIDINVLEAILKTIATDKAIENLLLEKMQACGIVAQEDVQLDDAEQSVTADAELA
jgi:hypothetical protein